MHDNKSSPRHYPSPASLSYAIFVYAFGIFMFALIWSVLSEPFNIIRGIGYNLTTMNASTQGIGYIDTAWTYLPLFFLLAGFMFLVAEAVWQSRRGI